MSYDIPGDLLILLAFVFNLLSGLAFFLTARGSRSYESLALKSYHVLMVCVSLAVAYLFYLFLSHNHTIKYVFEYSDRSLPFFYLVSAFWGGQEGTYLLWLFLSIAFGYLIIRKGQQYRNYAIVAYSAVNFFFLLILLRLSPFALLGFHATDGAGLNPLLQDPWMVIHPPVIFAGYAMSAVPFTIAVAALILNDYADWVRRVFPWVVMTALALGAGNVLGAYWAYKTLGWGGYWGWDPVENSSLVPWLVSLALLHGLVIEKRSGALRKSNFLLTALVFVLVIYGTFLTRSGILADFSVHSFVDLGANRLLVAFLAFCVLPMPVLLMARFRALGHLPLNYSFYGKEFSLLAATTLLFIFSAIVLFWSSLPILSGMFSDQPRAADVATYNQFALPFAIVFSLLLAVTPFLKYDRLAPGRWRIRLACVAVGSAVIGLGLFYLAAGASPAFAAVFTLVAAGLAMYVSKLVLAKPLLPSLVAFAATVLICPALGVTDYLYVLYFALAAMVVVSNLVSMARYLRVGWKAVGGHVAHVGFGLTLIGVLASSGFATSERLVLPRGQSSEAYGLTVAYRGMDKGIFHQSNRLLLTCTEGESVHEALPQLYYSERLNGMMKKPYIKRSILYDLYFSPEQVQQLSAHGGLMLRKGETHAVGEYEFTFTRYSMDAHGSDSGMTVIAHIEVNHNGMITHLEPGVRVVPGKEGNNLIDIPVQIGDTMKYTMTIGKILADEGAVALSVPGLIEAGPPDRLILDISKKPAINLLWVGTTLMLVGSLIAFLRRRSELPA